MVKTIPELVARGDGKGLELRVAGKPAELLLLGRERGWEPQIDGGPERLERSVTIAAEREDQRQLMQRLAARRDLPPQIGGQRQASRALLRLRRIQSDQQLGGGVARLRRRLAHRQRHRLAVVLERVIG